MHYKRVIMTAICLLISSCSTAKEAEDTPAPSGSGSPVTIKLHTWNHYKSDHFDLVIREFERRHPNIKVQFVSPGNNHSAEAMRQVDLAAASGEELDVIMVPTLDSYQERAALNMFEPLDEYMDKEGLIFEEEYVFDTLLKDKRYGIPGKASVSFVIINESHLNEAGLTVPKNWTWDEYLEYARKLTKTDGGKKRYGTYFHSWSSYMALALNNQKENNYFVMDDHRTANIMNPLMKKSLEIRLEAERNQSATPYAEMLRRKLEFRPQYFHQDASMLIVGSYILAELGGSDQARSTFKTVFAPYPKYAKDDPMTSYMTNDILTVFSKSKHKQEAYTFIRWYSTEGIVLQGRFLPSWRKANLQQVVDTIVSKTAAPENIDKESLLYVLQNTAAVKSKLPVRYKVEVEKIMQEEFDKMMLDQVDVQTTMTSAQEKIQKLIDSKE